MVDKIFINGNIPSFKNSKQITRSGFLVMSKTVRKYLKAYEHEWEDEDTIADFKEMLHGRKKPYVIGFHFVRGTRHKFDIINMLQGCQDLMAKHEWIVDDNADELIPSPLMIDGRYWTYDHDNPGVYIQVL